ncbi:MAG: NAD(P)-binding domain-containing protein, partial [Gammaproteobacteria bacterium]|nr:NAD(P)-binding domain-containing protein [Phycisphaerae bacterium]NIQ74041.1 NAD(P)-binding domain-containing protein [Gammaproteobacteria bacterium]NIP54099.1 NAD(P)-binding domain-containing protein [Phycisphaerae bacterium]NIR93343.1 NAD(P)-binding domain-containing protein [Gammaproteobacteria bacterium]NIW43603.1 NAD(P)-binding domain-containing protein [Gammaproteobacteria bacterium]
IGGLINNGYPVENICGTDINAEQRQLTADNFNIEVMSNNAEAIRHANVIVLGVKPQSVRETLLPLKDQLEQSNA